MIDIYLSEGYGPPLTNEGGTLQHQNLWMTGNLQFGLLCHLPISRRSLVPLPLSVMITRAGERMCVITVVEALSVVLRENRMRLGDLTDLEVSIEWTWTGTMIGYLRIHTCATTLSYLRVPMLAIANGEFGIAHDGQNRRGMIPITMIPNIDRAVPFLTLTRTVGTRIMTTDLLGGRIKIDSGIKVDLGQIGIGDLSSVILPLLLPHQTPGRLGRSVKRGTSGNGTQEGGQRTLLRPSLVQIVGTPRERL